MFSPIDGSDRHAHHGASVVSLAAHPGAGLSISCGNKSMTKLLSVVGFKGKQYGLTVVEYVLGAIALALIIGSAMAAFKDPLTAMFAKIL